MRFLANENIPGDAVTTLREAGHDGAWIRADSPGLSDVEASGTNLLLRVYDQNGVAFFWENYNQGLQ
jgi:hypothetical protein